MNAGKIGMTLAAVGCLSLSSLAETLLSPNGTCKLEVGVAEGGVPVYSLTCKGKTAIRESRLGFVFAGRGGARDGRCASGFELDGIEKSSFDETWRTVWGEEDEIRDRHEELLAKFVNRTKNCAMNVRFRLFDDGLGFRYEFPLYGQSTESYLRIIWKIGGGFALSLKKAK